MRLTVLILITGLLVTACKNKTPGSNIANLVLTPPPSPEYPKGVVPDSSDLYAVLKDSRSMKQVFLPNLRPVDLAPTDLTLIDSLLNAAGNYYNERAKKKGLPLLFEMKEYRRQIIAAIDSNGHKQIYINCFTGWAMFEKYWKKYLQRVNDGGTGFFQIRMDLTTKKYYNFWVNGLA